jgi:hypothetical protein
MLIYILIGFIHAQSLDSIIDKASSKYNIKPIRLKMIAQVESNYDINVRINYNTNGTSDHGPFQINTVIWKTDCKEFNINDLQDHGYCAASLVAKHKKFKEIDDQWLARYHSKTPKYKKKYFKKLQKAKKYIVKD